MRTFLLKRYGSLFYTTGTIKGKNDIVSCKLLIDTGSTYTILPWELLYNIGADPTLSTERVQIITASGYVLAPKVRVEWIHSLGTQFELFPVVCYTLPTSFYIDGILGMDFLKKAKIHIHIFEGKITIND